MDPVGICNLALGWLGSGRLSQLDADSPLSTIEELCAEQYPAALRAVLASRAWAFATTRLLLGPASSTGLADFPSAYPIPTTVLRVLACDDGSGVNEIDWRREGRNVLTATSPSQVYAKVVQLLEDAAQFPPSFCRVLAARLAADLAIPVSENRQLAADMEQRYHLELREAARLDGEQGTGEPRRTSGIAAARW